MSWDDIKLIRPFEGFWVISYGFVVRSSVEVFGGPSLAEVYMEPRINPEEVHANWEQFVTPVCSANGWGNTTWA